MFGFLPFSVAAFSSLVEDVANVVVESVKGGAVSRSKASRKRVVVEVDGKQYVVPVEGLQEFLSAIPQKTEVSEKKRQKSKAEVYEAPPSIAPVVKVISAPLDEIALIQSHIDRTNEILAEVWRGAMQRYINELEDEECLLMLL